MPATDITVGDHPSFSLGGLTFNTDTISLTVVAGVIVVGLGLFMARRAHSGVPSKLQLAFEAVVDYVESQVSSTLKVRSPFVVPLAVTIFVFLLICNWLTLIVFGQSHALADTPTADVNLTYALGLTVMVLAWYKAIRVRGARAYFSHFVKPYAVLLPINIIEELIKPITLALRLFGNIFAGGVMLLIIALMPVYMLWIPNALWKIVDVGFVGPIQAFIFALLTIIYFSQAVAPDEEH